MFLHPPETLPRRIFCVSRWFFPWCLQAEGKFRMFSGFSASGWCFRLIWIEIVNRKDFRLAKIFWNGIHCLVNCRKNNFVTFTRRLLLLKSSEIFFLVYLRLFDWKIENYSTVLVHLSCTKAWKSKKMTEGNEQSKKIQLEAIWQLKSPKKCKKKSKSCPKDQKINKKHKNCNENL